MAQNLKNNFSGMSRCKLFEFVHVRKKYFFRLLRHLSVQSQLTFFHFEKATESYKIKKKLIEIQSLGQEILFLNINRLYNSVPTGFVKIGFKRVKPVAPVLNSVFKNPTGSKL
jgi:hypothetical protein